MTHHYTNSKIQTDETAPTAGAQADQRYSYTSDANYTHSVRFSFLYQNQKDGTAESI